MRAYQFLIDAPDVTSILFTERRHAPYDIVIVSARTTCLIELKERSPNYSSFHLPTWHCESTKVEKVIKALEWWTDGMFLTTFPHEGRAFLWPIDQYEEREVKKDSPLTQARKGERRNKAYRTYRGSRAQVLTSLLP